MPHRIASAQEVESGQQNDRRKEAELRDALLPLHVLLPELVDLVVSYAVDRFDPLLYLFNFMTHSLDNKKQNQALLVACDSTLIVQDCVEGIFTVVRICDVSTRCSLASHGAFSSMVVLQTHNMIQQSVQARHKFVAFLGKLDRCLLELNLDPGRMYRLMSLIVEGLNQAVLSQKQTQHLCELLSPPDGNVIFGSAMHGWGFTVATFARMYHVKFGIPQDILSKRLWGDHYFNQKQKKWQTVPQDDTGKPLSRSYDS